MISRMLSYYKSYLNLISSFVYFRFPKQNIKTTLSFSEARKSIMVNNLTTGLGTGIILGKASVNILVNPKLIEAHHLKIQ